ncbi:MAG TPA: hypothetical protein VMU02_04770 [bacterium]|nr:hypothetical protein [bacterium]
MRKSPRSALGTQRTIDKFKWRLVARALVYSIWAGYVSIRVTWYMAAGNR